jgi:hypothetical protein
LHGGFQKQGLQLMPASAELRSEFFAEARAAREKLGEQLVPQAPQWLASLCRLKQVPPQSELSLQQAETVVSAQMPAVMRFESSVTAPLRASARPWREAVVWSAMLVRARMFPTKLVLVPMVAELPTCQ